ncbi:unnamed protein product [Cylindrotheca closterium]|uniref:Subtilisin n=1 Tax=Cylindrotheca closterium TaxID=2856 RepID=A0AAD2FJJ9_9STRA|nr:unnamed protein product [Cylindrotheca closterium]
MLFQSTIVASLIVSAAALRPNNGIPADSKAGMKLLSEARQLNQEEQDDDMSWIAGYSIKYIGCSSLLQIREDGGEEGSNLYTMNLAKFALCDSGNSCSSCGSGAASYVVNMETFVDAYTEMALNAQETACENIRENCDCENANDDDACENQCYTNMGMDSCIEYEGGEEFEIQEYLECREIENENGNNNNNNNNGYYQQYYVGPTCSNGFDINLAVFTDEGCSTKATGSGIYESMNYYGNSLPYEKESIVSSDCISCIDTQNDNGDDNQNNNNNNNNGQQEYDILELCENTYEDAAKCEKSLSGKYYNDDSGCNYINNVLPTLEKATNSITKSSGSRSARTGDGSAATGWAIFFFLTAVVMSAYAFFLYRKIHRAKVNLSSSEGQLA